MKTIVVLAGLLAGFVAASLAIVHLPRGPQTVADFGDVERYEWTAVEYHGRIHDTPSLFGIAWTQQERLFGAATLRDASAAILLLRDVEGVPRALATRIQVRNPDSELLDADLGVETYTNIFWPNRGSVLAASYENRWPQLESLVAELQGEVPTDAPWLVSSVGGNHRALGIVGGSGAFDGAEGEFSERLQLDPSAPGGFRGTLGLMLK